MNKNMSYVGLESSRRELQAYQNPLVTSTFTSYYVHTYRLTGDIVNYTHLLYTIIIIVIILII